MSGMPEFNTREILDLGAGDDVLRDFFARLVRARRILVNDGQEQFIVEYQRVQMTEAARKILTGGGPAVD